MLHVYKMIELSKYVNKKDIYVCISGLHHQLRQLFDLTTTEIDKNINQQLTCQSKSLGLAVFLGLIFFQNDVCFFFIFEFWDCE